MKIQSSILSILFFVNSPVVLAYHPLPKQTQTQENKQESGKKTDSIFKHASLEALYSYIDFKFNSISNNSFNRYQGYSKIYSLGEDPMKLNSTLYAGVYVYEVDTVLSSQTLLPQSSLTFSNQTIANKTLFGHLLKVFTPQFYIDAAGAYGQNKIATQTWISPNTANELTGQANYHNTNWFASINALYRKTWKKAILKTNAGALFTEVNSGNYFFNYQPPLPTQIVAPLTTRTTFILENAELGYIVNETLTPFINGGLIQVAQFSNSRSLVGANINGSLPQLNMNQNGFRLGAGITITHKQFNLRLEQKYYNAEGVFRSNQTLLALEYQFS